MKLSEALMLGSTLGMKPHNYDGWSGCLLGVACRAAGADAFKESNGDGHWTWLARPLFHPRAAFGVFPFGRMLLSDLCHEVERGRMSIQQAAELVSAVEPQELREEQTDVGQEPGMAKLEECDESKA